jgi:hypothetical protein
VIFGGDRRALERAVANDALAARNTGLADRLRGPRIKQKTAEGTGTTEKREDTDGAKRQRHHL